jgi:hypothetical protein
VGGQWQLDGDALDCAGLRLTFQRIGLGHWRPTGVLRSWGLAPLHRQDDTLYLPCGSDEALWIGAWAEEHDAAGEVALLELGNALQTTIHVPAQGAITALGGQRAISRPADRPSWLLTLRVVPRGSEAAQIGLMLMAPAAWCSLSGRAWQALSGPPPLPPRLG